MLRLTPRTHKPGIPSRRSCALSYQVLVVALLAAFPTRLTAQFGSLESRIPSGANTVVVFDVERVLASPFAVANELSKRGQAAFESGLSVLPPSATHLMMASQMDLEYMKPTWSVSLMRMSETPSLPEIAARYGGEMDMIAKRNGIRLPNDGFLVAFGKERIGVYHPANRQSVSRWLTSTDTFDGSTLTPYLQKALSYTTDVGTPIILAMDLSQVASSADVLERLKSFGSLQGKDVDLEALSQKLASIRGITLGIKLTDRSIGALKVDFDEDVSVLGDLAKPILLEALGRNGVLIDEFAGWQAKVSKNRVQIAGEFKESGLQRIFSLFGAPSELQASTSPGNLPEDETKMTLLASQQYFHSVQNLVDDLKDRPKQTMGQIGAWCGRYAERIDNLPILHVDSELLDYGGYVSQSLRQAETVLRRVGGRTKVRQMNAPARYDGYGRYGYGYGTGYGNSVVAYEDYRAERSDQMRIRSEERVSGADNARSIMQEIKKATADVRRKMTEKYQAEF